MEWPPLLRVALTLIDCLLDGASFAHALGEHDLCAIAKANDRHDLAGAADPPLLMYDADRHGMYLRAATPATAGAVASSSFQAP